MPSREEVHVLGRDAELAEDAGRMNLLDVGIEGLPLGRDEKKSHGVPDPDVRPRDASPRRRVVDRADHVERLLGQVVVLPETRLLEALDGVRGA